MARGEGTRPLYRLGGGGRLEPPRITARGSRARASCGAIGSAASRALAPEVRVTDADGELLRTLTWEPEEFLSREEALEAVREAADKNPDRIPATLDDLETFELWLEEQGELGDVPVFSDLLVDEQGYVWVRLFDPARDARALSAPLGYERMGPGGEWRVFSPEGEDAGTIPVPEGLVLEHIGDDAVVGSYRTDEGVQEVRIHSLERGRH